MLESFGKRRFSRHKTTPSICFCNCEDTDDNWLEKMTGRFKTLPSVDLYCPHLDKVQEKVAG